MKIPTSSKDFQTCSLASELMIAGSSIFSELDPMKDMRRTGFEPA